MSEIKNVMMEILGFQTQAEVDEFLQNEQIDGGTVIQTLIFDKEVFETASEAVEWAATHGFRSSDPVEKENTWHITQIPSEQFMPDSFRTIDLPRRGIKAIIGRMMDLTTDQEFVLSLRNSDIKLNANVPHIIEMAKVASGIHRVYGQIEITRETLLSFHDNHKNKVIGKDVHIDFEHDSGAAAGWIRSTFLSLDGNTLFGEISWTPDGALALSTKRYRYFSPMYSNNHVHQLSGASSGPTLTGGALVNDPFLLMDAIVGLSKGKKINENKSQENEMETIALSVHNEQVGGLNQTIGEIKLSEQGMKMKVENLENDNKKLSAQVKELEDGAKKVAREAAHQKLFDAGTINAAQLVALNEGKPAMEVIALSGGTNVKAAGHGGTDDGIYLSAEDQEFATRLKLTKEEWRAANPV